MRTGWDLLLSALAFEAGSEILMTSITIKGAFYNLLCDGAWRAAANELFSDMYRIVEAHGLVPVGADVTDISTLVSTITPN